MRNSTGAAVCARAGTARVAAASNAAASRRGQRGYLMTRSYRTGATILQARRSTPLARNECLEGGDRFVGAHPFAEQMGLLVDPAGHILRRQFQELARDRDSF